MHDLNDSDPDYTFNHWGYPAIINKIFPDNQPELGKSFAINWATNADRTLEAEQAIFDQFTSQTNWTLTGGHSFSDIALTLVEFNTTGESEQYDYAWSEADGSQSRTKHDDVNHTSISSINAAFGKKLALLNAALEGMGFKIDLTDPKWGYQESQGQPDRTC